ncbi:MAG: AMP-binding protein [Salinivirgaceae bacterium]|nr:AMP-binding protein [Salinivirgaceae bacterium]
MLYTKDLNAIAIITKEKSYSYTEFLSLVEIYSQHFNGKNYEKVAMYSENRMEWIAAFYAGWKNNCIVVTIDYMASIDDVSYILNDCQPELIFTSNGLKDSIEEIKKKIEYTPDILFLDNTTTDQEITITEWKKPKDLNDTAVIIYTSGTTGNPKGVMLSYINILSNISGVTEDAKIYTKDQQVLILLPLHHVFPLIGSMVVPLHIGATIVMSPSMQSPDLLETLKNNKVAVMIGVPRLYELLYKGLKAKVEATAIGKLFYKIVKASGSKSLAKKIFKKVHVGFGGNLLYMVSGGAALPKHVGEFFKTLGFDVLEGFGMTEAAPMITFTRPGKVKIGSPGHPLAAMKVEIRDGEIVAKGSNVMKGYYNRPEETAAVIKDGWLYTGDLGHFDKEGFLHITGRKKDIIILSNGKNINPVQLEMQFEKSFDEVKEAGVFHHQGQLYIAIHADKDVLDSMNVTDVNEHFRNNVLAKFNSTQTSYNRIMKFVLVYNDLPRTRLSKIQRFRLPELVTAPTISNKEEAFVPTEDYAAIQTFLESQVDIKIEPNHHLEFDLALDSLGKMGLIDFIDKSFGIKMDEKKLISFPSVRKLSEYVHEERKWFKNETINWEETLKEKFEIRLPKSWFTHTILSGMAKVFFKIYFRFKGKGADNIPEGACIITPNHESFFDGMFVTSFLKNKVMKLTYFYAKKKHVNNAFLRFMARTNNIIVMDLEQDLKESIQKLAAALKAGKKIMIFPEGTRTLSGEIGEFKKTFAILSTILDVPVVPVAINGAGKAMPVGSFFPRLGKRVDVTFLKPINPKGHTTESLVKEVVASIKESLKKSRK